MAKRKKAAKAKAKRKRTPPEYLVFVDTNIFLDFYRLQGQTSFALLTHLASIKDNLIMTEQVAMEFRKNRQNVIQKTQDALSLPDKISPPLFLANARAVKTIKARLDDATKRIRALKEQLTEIMLNPTTKDEVYKTAQRLFRNDDSSCTISRYSINEKERYHIRRLARKRFLLGYPPRKHDDTSIGDAVNWESIIWCAQQSNKNVVIVSRDRDYGVTVDKDHVYINDWLAEEFKARVSRQKTVELTNSLTTALKLVGVKVTQQEAKEETDFVDKTYPSDVQPLTDDEIRQLVLEALTSVGEPAPKTKGALK